MKQIAIALSPSLAFVNSAQAGNNLPVVKIVKATNQSRHFRHVAVNHPDTDLAVFGWVDAQLKATFHRDKSRQQQNPMHNETIER